MPWILQKDIDQLTSLGVTFTWVWDQTETLGFIPGTIYELTVTGTDGAPDNFTFTGSANWPANQTIGGPFNALTGPNDVATEVGSGNPSLQVTISVSPGIVNGKVNVYKIFWAESGSSFGKYSETGRINLGASDSVSTGITPNGSVSTWIVPPGIYKFEADDSGCAFTILEDCSSGSLTYAAEKTLVLPIDGNKITVDTACYMSPDKGGFEAILKDPIYKVSKDGSIDTHRRLLLSLNSGIIERI